MKAILCGTGWRAAFYLRIAEAFPSLLSIEAIFTRSEERRIIFKEKGYNACTDLSEALSFPHDIVIVASGKEGFYPLMKTLGEREEFVLSETTFLSLTEEELKDLSTLKGAVAEQYRYTPLFASSMAACKLIGDVSQLYLSGLHNHHAAAFARDVLHIDSESIRIVSSCDFPSSIVRTGSREGMVVESKMEPYTRKLRILQAGDKLFINDFSSNQYHSYLYGRSFEIRGDRGVVNEREVRYVNEKGFVCVLPFAFHRDVSTGNGSLTLSHVTLGTQVVFRNPFYPANLNDDEIAIAEILRRISSGETYPTIQSGIEDARIGRLL